VLPLFGQAVDATKLAWYAAVATPQSILLITSGLHVFGGFDTSIVAASCRSSSTAGAQPGASNSVTGPPSSAWILKAMTTSNKKRSITGKAPGC